MTSTSGNPGISISNEITLPDHLSPGNGLTWLGAHDYPSTSALLLQTNSYLLLQNGSKLLLQAA